MAEQMKPSGIDWIGDIPESWKVKPLKYLAKCNQDVLLETTASDYSFRYVDIGSVTYERGITEYQELRFEDSPSRARRRVSVGDTIISTVRTYLKAIAIISDSENVIVSTGFAVYTPDKAIYPQYLYYFCKSEGFVQEIDKNSYGIAYPAINTDLLSRICIAYPCYEEQQVISDFLDKECARIDSIAADLEKQIALLQQYKKSLITETVTKGLDKFVPMKDSGVEFFGKIPAHWKVSKTKYVADISIGLVTTMTANYVDEDGVPLIRNSNIRTNHIDDNGMVYLSKEFAKANIGRALHKGDIVTVHTGDVGTSAIINETYHMSHGFATIISRLKTKTVNNQFLCWLYNSEIFKEMSIAYSTGDGRQNLNLYDFVDFYILIPTLKEQMEIVNWLNLKCTEIDNFIENKQQQLLLIQQHKKSLIYEYVTGKKRVKEVQ